MKKRKYNEDFYCSSRNKEEVIEKYHDRKGFRMYYFKCSYNYNSQPVYGIELSIYKGGKEVEGVTFCSWPGSGVEPPLYEFFPALDLLKRNKIARRWFMKRAWEFMFYDKPMKYYFYPGTYRINQDSY